MSDLGELVAQLQDEAEGAKLAAIATLTQQVNDAYGADAAFLAEQLRAHGVVMVLVGMLDDPVADVQQCAMSVLGNLLTNIFEPNAAQSLSLFDECGGMSRLVGQLSMEYPHNLYAAACMQNVTALDPDRCCVTLKQLGAPEILQQLCSESAESDGQANIPHPPRNPKAACAGPWPPLRASGVHRTP